MARYKQIPQPPDQIMLFGTSVEDALPAENDVRSFNDAMDCLDYSAIQSRHTGPGAPPYPPRQMVKVLVYAYSKGIRSSRKIEEMLYYDIRFIFLSGGLKPDHNTLARFRKDYYQQFSDLFVDSVRVCTAAGIVLLSSVATDGTKIKAAASRASIYGKCRIERELAAVERILAEAEETDAAEDKEDDSGSGSKLPEHLRDALERKAYLKQIADKLKQTNRATAVESDPDSKVMRTTDGTRPCYNLQASVDSKEQVIVAMKLIQHEVDSGELPAMVEEVISNTGLIPELSLADCGYCDEPTLKWIEQSGHNVLMPVRTQYREKRRRNDLFASRCFLAPAEIGDESEDALICPAGKKLTFRVEHFCGGGTYRQYVASGCQECSFYTECVKSRYGCRRVNVSVVASVREKMTKRLSTDEGRRLFRLRGSTVEPVFGQLKRNLGFSRFLCWGLAGAKAEAALISIAHNIRKYIVKVASPLVSLLLHQFIRCSAFRRTIRTSQILLVQ